MKRGRRRESVLVVGGGIAGLATAWHLARRGVPVVVLERERSVFRHSSGVNAGILRAVVEDAAVAPLAAAGARALLTPDRDLDERSFVDPVGLVLTADQAAAAEHLAAMVALSSVPVHTLDPASVRARYPHVATQALVAFESPTEGTIDLERLSQRLVSAIERAGGAVRCESAVRDWLGSDGEVDGVVLGSGEELCASSVVLAAGGWAHVLAARAGSRVVLEPTRRHVALATIAAPIDPRWPVIWNSGSNFYSRPYRGGLMVCDCDQTVVDPDALMLDDGALLHLAQSLRKHLTPAYADARLDGWCGMRTFASDHRFVIGSDPDVRGLVWAAALGGHGITCGLEVGRLAAAAALGEASPDCAAFSPARAVRGSAPL